jgi:hypothetical protein
MKKLALILMVLAIGQFAFAQCDPLDPNNSTFSNFAAGYITIPDGAPDANVRATFHSYEILGAGTTTADWPSSFGWSFSGADRWLTNSYGVWWLAGSWAGGATTSATACPEFNAGAPNNNMVVIAAYDSDMATGTNATEFVVYTTDYDAGGVNRYEFDQVAGSVGVMQAIPQITITAFNDPNFDLAWVEPGNYAYDKAGIVETMYGYQIYYGTSPETSGAGPTNQDIGAWTAISAADGGVVPIGNTTTTVLNIPAAPAGQLTHFAMSVLGSAEDSGGVDAPGFQSGFVGQNSSNYVPGPTAIDLVSFGATSSHGKVTVKWATASEVNTAGFNIYRADNMTGLRIKVNDSLIPAQGTATSGARYKIVDDNVKVGSRYFYWLEEKELDNTVNQYGAVGIVVEGKIGHLEM